MQSELIARHLQHVQHRITVLYFEFGRIQYAAGRRNYSRPLCFAVHAVFNGRVAAYLNGYGVLLRLRRGYGSGSGHCARFGRVRAVCARLLRFYRRYERRRFRVGRIRWLGVLFGPFGWRRTLLVKFPHAVGRGCGLGGRLGRAFVRRAEAESVR